MAAAAVAGGNIKWFNICRNYFHISSIHGIDAAAAAARKKEEQERGRERQNWLGPVATHTVQERERRRDEGREHKLFEYAAAPQLECSSL